MCVLLFLFSVPVIDDDKLVTETSLSLLPEAISNYVAEQWKDEWRC